MPQTSGFGRVKLVVGLVFALALFVAGFVLITKTAGATPGDHHPRRPAASSVSVDQR